MTHPELLIAAHCKNFISDGAVMGRLALDLFHASRRGKFDPCEPRLFNPGFPFRVWRDSGIGYALGRNRPEYSIDGQASAAAEAVAMAGSDGVIVTANPAK